MHRLDEKDDAFMMEMLRK